MNKDPEEYRVNAPGGGEVRPREMVLEYDGRSVRYSDFVRTYHEQSLVTPTVLVYANREVIGEDHVSAEADTASQHELRSCVDHASAETDAVSQDEQSSPVEED